jgi:hypothetical protein
MVLNKSLLIPALIFVLLGLMFVPMSSAQAHSTIGVTKVSRFFPTGVRNTGALTGNCWETSLAAPRPDSWRCIVKDTIYDPCFSATHNDKYVICDANPAGDTRGIKVILTDPLPVSTATWNDHQPWTLRLSNGAVCAFLTGASPIIAGQRANYGCTNNALIPGSPKEGHAWTVSEKLPDGGPTLTTLVTQAWT